MASWLTAVAVCLTVWLVSAPDTSGFAGPLRVAGQLWLLAHHAGLAVPTGRVVLAPLGFTALCVVALLHAAAGPITRTAQLPYAALGAATGYGGVAALITYAARTSDVRPDVAQAVLAAGCFGALVPTATYWRRILDLGFPLWTEDAARAAALALAALLGGGAALFAGSFVLHAFVARGAAASAWPASFSDALGMFALALAVFPNAVTWAAAYLVGPGFAVGVGTAVGPLGVRIGAQPAFPLLAAVPATSTYPYALAALAVPLAAGVCVGVLVRRARWPFRKSLRATGAATLSTALVLGLLATLSGGPVGGGRMATLGPSGWRVATATLVLLGVGAGTVVVLPEAVRAIRRWSVQRMLRDARTQSVEAWGSVLRASVSLVPKRRVVDERGEAAGVVMPDGPSETETEAETHVKAEVGVAETDDPSQPADPKSAEQSVEASDDSTTTDEAPAASDAPTDQSGESAEPAEPAEPSDPEQP